MNAIAKSNRAALTFLSASLICGSTGITGAQTTAPTTAPSAPAAQLDASAAPGPSTTQPAYSPPDAPTTSPAAAASPTGAAPAESAAADSTPPAATQGEGPTDADSLRSLIGVNQSGLKTADLPKLFFEFQQLESGSGRRHDGTGLGLVLTKRLAELHGGSIRAESEVGKGSLFTVKLPLDAPSE